MEQFSVLLANRIPKKFDISDYNFFHHIQKMSLHYLVRCRTCSPDQSYIMVSLKYWMVIMLYSNFNFRQATSEELLQVISVCVDEPFQSYSALINRIIHHDVLAFSPCLNKSQPQLVHILD